MTLRAFCLLTLIALAAPCETLRVMTFNVRYPNPGDGPNVWAARQEIFAETIRANKPDLFGTQELFYSQAEDITKSLSDYQWFGVSRRGNREDEHMGVFYRPDRLTLKDSGNFWLSETFERPGSISWGMSLPRMVTWGVFEIKSTGKKFLYLNTHFAHRDVDEEARRKSAQLIACRIALQDPDLGIVLTGDFNAPAGGGAYSLLSPPLKDAWKEAAERAGPEGTFHNFSGNPGAARIDWILYRAPWKVLRAETITSNRQGRFPSDHFPVLAVFELP